jgi:hypothetical protein
MFEGKLASLGGALAAAVLGFSGPACAAAPMLPNPFGDGRGAPAPSVARFVAQPGQSFVFDRQAEAPDALLKFDNDPEVWVLQPTPAPRGDTIYRNDAGDTVLRTTRLGGVTLFTDQDPEGMPAAVMGDADELLLPAVAPPGVLLQRAIVASDRASRAAQHQITFDAPSVTLAAIPVFSDAFIVAADAIVHLGRRSEAKGFLARLDKVTFIAGARPDVVVNGAVMTVVVAPGKGFAGRPSSVRIIKTALKR